MLRRFVAILILSLALVAGPPARDVSSSAGQVYVSWISIPTYPYANFLEWLHSDPYNIDYPRLRWAEYQASNPQPSPQDYAVVVLENQWLQLEFLPELGGRLYGILDKAANKQLLYQNPVVKPTHWGPPEQGWWLAAGGIEWCLPVEEHGYEWGVPWDYSLASDANGSTIVLWDTLATDRIRAKITVYLPADEAAFTITPKLENPTGAPVTFKYWSNAMLAPGRAGQDNTVGPELRFGVPIDQVTVHSTGNPSLPGPGQPMSWPIYNGIDYSHLLNWQQWLGFFARPSAEQDWAGTYDWEVLRGVARVFPHQVAVGVKGFAMGWQQPINFHEWTDVESYYVELHGGPSPTFWDSIVVGAGGHVQWTETWIPIHGLPALSIARSRAALGVRAAGEDLQLGLETTAARDGLSLELYRKADCAPLWSADSLSLGPGGVYTHTEHGLGLSEDEVVFRVWDDGLFLISTAGLLCAYLPEHLYLPLVLRGAPSE